MKTALFLLALLGAVALALSSKCPYHDHAHDHAHGHGHGHGHHDDFIVHNHGHADVKPGKKAKIPDHCNQELDAFYVNNQGHMDAIAPNPVTDLWYQNITVSQHNNVTGVYEIAYIYGYWQSRIYNPAVCAFEEVQAWLRGEQGTALAFQQINSIVKPPQTLSPSPSYGTTFAPQSYDIVWTTNYTADSASVENAPATSITIGQGIVQNAFYDANGFVKFYSMLQTAVKGQRRLYVQIYTYDPTQLPIHISIDSYVVPREAQPAIARNGFDAWRSGQIPVLPDPNDPTRYVYVYNEPPAAPASEAQN